MMILVMVSSLLTRKDGSRSSAFAIALPFTLFFLVISGLLTAVLLTKFSKVFYRLANQIVATWASVVG